MRLTVWSSLDLSFAVGVTVFSCVNPSDDVVRLGSPFAYRIDRRLYLRTSLASRWLVYLRIIVCALQVEGEIKGVYTVMHTRCPFLGVYSHREMRKWLRKRHYCTPSFSECVRSGHGDVGRYQCCQETPGGAREETGDYWSFRGTSNEWLGRVSKF